MLPATAITDLTVLLTPYSFAMKSINAIVSVLSLLVSRGFSVTDDECFGLMFNLARETITGDCPTGDDLSVNCELDCFKDYVNLLHVLHIAGCRDDIFACHTKPEKEQCEDEPEDTVCHQGSGNCLKECSDDYQCNGGSEDGPSCMQGVCVESEHELVQMTLMEKANQATGFCGIHEDTGMYCMYVAYGTFGELYAPEADTCGILESWGCCVGSVEAAFPGANYAGLCPTLTKGPQCDLDWVVKNPELNEGDYNYMDEFCRVCQESNFDTDCATMAPMLCHAVDLGYCSESACENFEEAGADGQQKCFDAVQASAAEACKEDSDSSSDDMCRRCSPKELKKERRHLNFMGDLPCCKSGRGWRGKM